jgi:hypothetical protein
VTSLIFDLPAYTFSLTRFNTGVNESEKTIVTSTGKYVITCEFRGKMQLLITQGISAASSRDD